MKTIKNFLAVMLSVFVLSGIAFAEPQKWDIDKTHSAVYFDVKHIYASTRGLFEDFSGLVLFDPESKQTSSVEFKVDVDSINTNISKRDTHLRGGDFFDSKSFPQMTFKSASIKHVEANEYIMEGDLTIKDITKRIAVPLTYYGMMENPMRMGSLVAGFEAAFTINRLDFNVGSGKFFEMGAIGKDVGVVISLEVTKNK